MLRKTWAAIASAVGIALLLAPPPAASEDRSDDPALTELVQILRDRGVLDDAQYQSLTAKATDVAQGGQQSWTDRIEMWGDFRARYESFYYSGDRVDGQRSHDERHRLRYRFRLNLKGDVNDYSDVFARITVGRDPRTTNNTLGDPLDFGANEIFLDKAYVRMSPFKKGRLPDRDGTLWFVFGRTSQPWRWDSVYKDWLLWDDEISPTGFYVDGKVKLNEQVQLFGNAGYYIIDENSNSKNPSLTNAQVGIHSDGGDGFDFGARGSWFYFWSLDEPFLDRGINSDTQDPNNPSAVTTAKGNTPGGLTGNSSGGQASVIEFGSYVRANHIERWPLMLFGHASQNLDASRSVRTNTGTLPGTFRTDREATAWLIGAQIGDPKEVLRFRVVYAELEANAFPAQFIDSDLFDQFTNRRGYVADLSKRIMQNTDANITAFMSDPLKDSGGYVDSIEGADRLRFQANLNYKF